MTVAYMRSFVRLQIFSLTSFLNNSTASLNLFSAKIPLNRVLKVTALIDSILPVNRQHRKCTISTMHQAITVNNATPDEPIRRETAGDFDVRSDEAARSAAAKVQVPCVVFDIDNHRFALGTASVLPFWEFQSTIELLMELANSAILEYNEKESNMYKTAICFL
ncbi:hypothetical protein HAX54_020656 [Datura stramonium]|uniref:Uncharacterized protein n=1 Tax=Datura stramonium TaxID=4076 RepID=A0ABS8S3F8_DATST|nr:hypothetical protein [Datura stramonium]